jgi:hypothetical protein
VRPEDCYPVNKSFRFDKVPVRLSSSELWSGLGEGPTFVEVVKVLMVEGGHWVWQPDRPPWALRGGFQGQCGRGFGNQANRGQ